MKLIDKLNNLCQSNDIKEIENLFNDAKGKVTFWGGRKITVNGYEGMVSLNEVSWKVLDLGERVELNLPNQKIRARICANLTKLYESTDKIAKKNIITRVILFFREFKIWEGFRTERDFVRETGPLCTITITGEDIYRWGFITDEEVNKIFRQVEDEYHNALNS